MTEKDKGKSLVFALGNIGKLFTVVDKIHITVLLAEIAEHFIIGNGFAVTYVVVDKYGVACLAESCR